jgi:hypothetical protein
MTQFSSLRQVFENFLDHQEQFINYFAPVTLFFYKTSLVRSEALDYGTAFRCLTSFLNTS